MSLADESSLLFIPTGYKEAKIYSVFPTTGVGDFTFNRNSSATRIAKNGLITSVATDIPRLEYPLIDGVVNGCPSLLLEPSRTNLVTYSEDFSNAAWSETGASVVSGFISPDGSLNAYKLVEDTSTLRHSTNTLNTVVGEHTFSVFAKKGEKDILQLSLGGASITPALTYSNFDLTNGTITVGVNTSSDIEEFANGWYRCSITASVNSGVLNSGCVVANSTTMGRNGTYQGDGTSGVYIYGAQLEQGSYPTSYIPTNGAAVTRAAETANGAGDATTFNDSEGVLMAEISALTEDSGLSRRITISDGSTNNRVSIELDETEGLIKLFLSGSGTLNQLSKNISDVYTPFKILASYELNSLKLYINGYKVAEDTSIVLPNGLDDLSFDSGTGSSDFYGKTKQIQYYNSALTDSELEQLTSWLSFTDMANGQLYTIE